MSEPNDHRPLMRTIPPDLQTKVKDIQTNVPRETGAPRKLDEEKTSWLVVGICLHSIISPLLRTFIDPIVENLYKTLVTNDTIDTQTYHGYLKKYPSNNQFFLNYESINNNRNLPKKKINSEWKKDYQNYDYNIMSHVDLSKLFLQPTMAHYSAIDESCDSSALINMIINISAFPKKIQTDAEQVLFGIRNPWAHCDFSEWTLAKYKQSFILMKRLVGNLGLSNRDENRILDELKKWAENGQNFLNGTISGLEIVDDIRQQTHVLSEYVQILCTKTDDQFIKVRNELKDIEDSLQKRIRYLESVKKLKEEKKKQDESHIPQNIRAQHVQEISEWEQDQNTFVTTRATRHILRSLLSSSCIVVSGSSGCGKSANIHHIALRLHHRYDYEIIPVLEGPLDILHFYDMNKRQVFVVDDICGKETFNEQSFQNWDLFSSQLQKKFKILENKVENNDEDRVLGPKLLISCRLHIYKEARFQLLTLFTRKHCNLLSLEFCLLPKERLRIMKKYIHEDIIKCIMQPHGYVDFFPLLCRLSKEKEKEEVIKLFATPVESIRTNINHIISSNKNQFCALVLCILSDKFNTDWLNLKTVPEGMKCKIQDIVMEFEIDLRREMSRNALKSGFITLDGTYLKQIGTEYRIIHDKIYTMAALICGHHLTECFIKHASSIFVRDHFCFEFCKTVGEDNIILSGDNEEEYFKRLLSDLRKYSITSTFHNKQLRSQLFIDRLIRYFERSYETKELLKRMNEEKKHIDLLFTTPLTEAAFVGNFRLVKFMVVSLKCNVNRTDIFGCSPLYKACKGGKTNVVKLLLDNSCDVCICNRFAMSSLFVACEGGYADIVNMLIENNADVYRCNSKGESPLYVACKGGHINTVKVLLQNKADASRCDNKGQSPLHVACAGGYIVIAKLLLNINADVVCCTKLGASPLFLACQGGYTEIVKFLLENKADVSQCNTKGESPLYAACKGGYTDTANLLLQNKADVVKCTTFGESPLFVACEEGHTNTVKLLLQNNALVVQRNNNGQSPFFVACKGGHTDTVQLLLKNNADVLQCNQTGESPLYVACETGKTDTVKLLLENGADLSQCDNEGKSPLYLASNGGHTDTVQLLLENNADILQCDRTGQSPLYVASETGHTNTVKVLLQNNADVSQCDMDGQSPFYVACGGGHKDTAKLLLRKNADKFQLNRYGWSPLHAAGKKGHTNIVKLLLLNNADVSHSNNDDESPLYLACKGGHIDTVQLLLQNKANVCQCNSNGESPLYVACKQRHVNIVRLLLESNADVSQCEKINGWSPLRVVCDPERSQYSIIQDVISFVERVQGLENFETRSIEIVKLLIKWNADVETCITNCKPPSEILHLLQTKLNHDKGLDQTVNPGLRATVITYVSSLKYALQKSDIPSILQIATENIRHE
ncbi:uncharacterized protein [Mytilus edulis]|uniref:uncharacterized protein n=1 Tax=Mytilus edulis TaxID=6550 RepID=UPI0039EF763B